MNLFRYLRTRSNGSSSEKSCHGRRRSRTRRAASRTICTFDHLEPRLAMAGDIGSLLAPPALIAATTATPARDAFVRLADNSTRLAAPLSNSTITYGFNSEDVITANWKVAGEWRIESTGIRLFGGQANLISKQTFGPSVQKITFSYAITDNTQMRASLWGETFRLDPPRGGGQITATIERSGNAVTFSNGISTPVTVILKQANAETPTTLLIQMDQRNLWRPVMQLLLQSVVVAQNSASLPAAPTGLGAIPGDREARLQWTSPAGNGGTPITDYVVQYSTNNGGSWTTVVDGVSSATSATVRGLTNGTSYVFRVAAVNSQGIGPFSGRAANSRPARWVLASSQSNPEGNGDAWTYDAATTIWSQRRTNGALFATYRELSRNAEYVEMRDDSRAFTLRLSATSATWKTDASPQWYTLGNGAWTEGPFSVTPATLPSSPNSVSGIAGSGQVSLTWAAPISNGGSAVTDYVVQYSSNGGTTWTTFADGISTLPRATVTGLTNGTSYVFRVAASNSVGTGFYSANSASIRPTAPITVPTAPTGVMPTIGNGRVTIRWNPPASNGGSAITRYVVQYSANGGSTWLNATIPASTRTTASVLNLTNGVGYVFRVAAVNAAGTGRFSSASALSTPVAGARTTIDLAP